MLRLVKCYIIQNQVYCLGQARYASENILGGSYRNRVGKEAEMPPVLTKISHVLKIYWVCVGCFYI